MFLPPVQTAADTLVSMVTRIWLPGRSRQFLFFLNLGFVSPCI